MTANEYRISVYSRPSGQLVAYGDRKTNMEPEQIMKVVVDSGIDPLLYDIRIDLKSESVEIF